MVFSGISPLVCAAGGGWLSMVGPLIWAPTMLIRSRSREDRRSGAIIGPGAPLGLMPPVRAIPDGIALHQHLFPALRQGGQQLCPLT